jgi:putative heme-binding domain-containing protein
MRARILFGFAMLPLPALSQANAFDTAEGRQQGAALFQTHCAYCHAAQGEGGRGADLTTGSYRHGGSDSELYATIRNGIPGSEMPSARASDAEVSKMAAYVKTLGNAGLRETARGNPSAGKALYAGKGGCSACHSIAGEGGTPGPDLSAVGRSHGLGFLMESLVAPEAEVAVPYRAVQVVTRSGDAVVGIRLNEDDISIQLRDSSDRLGAFFKDDLKEIRRDTPSLMPSCEKSLSAAEREDMVAFLSSPRGAQ